MKKKEVVRILRSIEITQIPHLNHVVNEAIEKVIEDNDLNTSKDDIIRDLTRVNQQLTDRVLELELGSPFRN